MMETFVSRSEEDTIEIGKRIAAGLTPSVTVLLYGQLGSGKTVLVRGIAQGLGVDESAAVRSPSFTLINIYPTRSALSLYHVDLYRLEGLRDFYSIGIEEILSSDAVVLIEWADRLPIPLQDAVTIRFTVADDETRSISVSR